MPMNNNIGFLRKKNGLSMQELADLVGTSQQQIDRLEKGQRRLTADWMDKLSIALNCKPAELIDFKAEKKPTAAKVETAIAKVIGAIETSFSNHVRQFTIDEEYEISFKPTKKDFGKKFFALVVEGGSFKNYPANSELIFAQGKISDLTPALREKKTDFASEKNSGNDYKFEIGKQLVEGTLVKSIRSES